MFTIQPERPGSDKNKHTNTRATKSFKPGGSAKFVRPVFSLFCLEHGLVVSRQFAVWNMVWSSLDNSLPCLKWPCNCQPHACTHHRVLLHRRHFSPFTLCRRILPIVVHSPDGQLHFLKKEIPAVGQDLGVTSGHTEIHM